MSDRIFTLNITQAASLRVLFKYMIQKSPPPPNYAFIQS